MQLAHGARRILHDANQSQAERGRRIVYLLFRGRCQVQFSTNAICIELDINAERRMHVLSGSPPFQCFAKKDSRITLVPRSRVMHPQYQVLFENLHLTCLLIMLIINVNYITLKKYRIENESKDSDYNHNSNYLN